MLPSDLALQRPLPPPVPPTPPTPASALVHAAAPATTATQPGTPAHTDQARAEWRQAQERADSLPPNFYPAEAAVVHEKREAFDAAVQAEIDAAPDFVGPVVPGTSRIEAQAQPVLHRYADDPAAIEVINGAVDELERLQPLSDRPQVAALLDTAGAQSDPGAVVQALEDGLPALSADDRAYLTTSPELATLLRDKVEPWVAEPYAGLEGDALTGPDAVYAANESARRLHVLAENLPPDLAYGVVLGNLDTIQNIAQLRPQYLGPPEKAGGESFGLLADVVGALGNTPEGQQLRTDIATMFVANGVDRGQGIPLETALAYPVAQGASPGLSLEIITQLEARGEHEIAAGAVDRLVEAGGTLADDIGTGTENYQRMLAELGTVLAATDGLPPEATSAGVQAWLDSQPPEWQGEFESLESGLIDRATAMRELLAGVSALPESLSGSARGELQDLFNRKDVLDAVNLAASRDRTFLTGPEADQMVALADPVRAGAAGADALRQIGNHVIQQQATLVFADLEHGNAVSVANAKTQLAELGERVGGLYGVDPAVYRNAVGALGEFADLPQNASLAQVQAAATRVDGSLSQIEGFGRDSLGGALLRSIGVAAGVLALNKYASAAADDGKLRDDVASIGSVAGIGSATIALLQRPGSVDISGVGALDDARGRLGPLGLANWGKALGVFSAVGDIAYLADALDRGETVEAGLHAVAGAGTVILSLASGPAGWLVGGGMIALSMIGQAKLAGFNSAEDAREASRVFLEGAGLAPEVVQVLGATGETEGHAAVPAVPLILEQAALGNLVGHKGDELDAEQAIAAMNAMADDPAALNALQAQVNNLRIANQHLLLEWPR